MCYGKSLRHPDTANLNGVGLVSDTQQAIGINYGRSGFDFIHFVFEINNKLVVKPDTGNAGGTGRALSNG